MYDEHVTKTCCMYCDEKKIHVSLHLKLKQLLGERDAHTDTLNVVWWRSYWKQNSATLQKIITLLLKFGAGHLVWKRLRRVGGQKNEAFTEATWCQSSGPLGQRGKARNKEQMWGLYNRHSYCHCLCSCCVHTVQIQTKTFGQVTS